MMITGKKCILEILKTLKIKYLFGNPGTTELALIDEISRDPSFNYILGLQESIVVSMADGFSRVNGELSFVNLHAAPGLGNAMGSIYNAKIAGSPILITAGQQEIGHGIKEPMLYDDLVSIAKPMVKWAYEITRTEDIPIVFKRAVKIALTPPTGPVFISLPGNILNNIFNHDTNFKITKIEDDVIPNNPVSKKIISIINKSSNPVIVVGHEIPLRDAFKEALEFAEKVGCMVWQHTIPRASSFVSTNNLFMGMLPRDHGTLNKIFKDHDLIIALGCDLLTTSVFSKISPIPLDMKIIHISERNWELGKNYYACLAVNSNIKSTLEVLNNLFNKKILNNLLKKKRVKEIKNTNWSAKRKKLLKDFNSSCTKFPFDVKSVNVLIGKYVNIPIVEEGLSSTFELPSYFKFKNKNSYFGLTSGGIGFACAGVIGISLRLNKSPLLAVIGDGSSLYSIQSLWTAANLKLPITYLILNNQGYQILKQRMYLFHGNKNFIGMDINNPVINFDNLSKTFGIRYHFPKNTDEIVNHLKNLEKIKSPQILDLRIKKSFK